MIKINIYIIIVIQLFLIYVRDSSIVNADNIKAENVKIEKSGEKPKIYFEKQIYDFGKIYIGDNVNYGFKFKNFGTGELIINDVKTSCGCTAAVVSKNHLLKEEEGVVEVKFNAGHYVGKVTKMIVVNSNDTENSKFKLTITGEVIEEVSVDPKRINFGIIRKGESATRSIEIKTVPELKIEVKKVESPNPYITITKDKLNENTKANYQVTFSKYDYIGRYNGVVFVYTSSNKQDRIDIPFSGEVIGDITFYPEKLSFGYVIKNQDVKRSVIVNVMNKDVKIEKIETDPISINYNVSEINNNSKKIDVNLSKDIAIGKITGTLKIYTNSSIQPVINIPINGEIKG